MSTWARGAGQGMGTISGVIRMGAPQGQQYLPQSTPIPACSHDGPGIPSAPREAKRQTTAGLWRLQDPDCSDSTVNTVVGVLSCIFQKRQPKGIWSLLGTYSSSLEDVSLLAQPWAATPCCFSSLPLAPCSSSSPSAQLMPTPGSSPSRCPGRHSATWV